jgi:hypothetical protein
MIVVILRTPAIATIPRFSFRVSPSRWNRDCAIKEGSGANQKQADLPTHRKHWDSEARRQ